LNFKLLIKRKQYWSSVAQRWDVWRLQQTPRRTIHYDLMHNGFCN